MATAIHLDPATERLIDDLVARGRFASQEEDIRTGIRLAWDEYAEPEPLTPSEIAGIERGLADLRAGRVIPIDQVMDEMERRHALGL